MRKSIIIIPALSPTRNLLDMVIDLQAAGFERIVVVNDGSGIKYENIFEQAGALGCDVVTHRKNLGKGAAIKSGIQEAIAIHGRGYGVITADCDGQHRVEDIVKIDDEMTKNPGKLVLGTRDFSGKNVPARSRIGNRITSAVFGLTGGKKCPDTQTGLRGIPDELLIMAMETEGSRYEYEMNFLYDASERCGMVFVPIATVYEDDNSCSHFRPVRDSLLIYGRLIRFMISSLTGSVVDFAVFTAMLFILPFAGMTRGASVIVAATVIARLASGVLNFVMNKIFAFKSRGNTGGEGIRYMVLFICQMGASAALVSTLSGFVPAIGAKAIVDSLLFFISYVIQKRWVFCRRTVNTVYIGGYRPVKAIGKGAAYER